MFGNITGTGPSPRMLVRENFDLPSLILGVLNSVEKLSIDFAKNFIWVAHNLSDDAKLSSEQERNALAQIFTLLLKPFSQSYDQEESLVEILKGLQNLSAASSEDSQFAQLAAS
mmetsp:Transcript_18407/g.31483  ORF Transcript_18407/g.31483 Transcript_18407/m.31483 type:complete len:114 (+) Transcript_18407:882-1223(+)